MRIIGLPLLSDNYAWLCCDEGDRACAVVDPSEAGPVLEVLRDEGLTLRWILATHHHADHIGGIPELLDANPGAQVLVSRPDLARVPGATQAVDDGAFIQVAGRRAQCLHVPGHTLGALAYYFPEDDAVFTGDTLFTGGCGRLFEGSAEQMHASLTRLAALPPATRVYCGHEYTVANLEFAARLEPGNEAVAARLEGERGRRSAGWPTVPATLRLERDTNPFLRSHDPALQRLTGLTEPARVFAELRRRKDVG